MAANRKVAEAWAVGTDLSGDNLRSVRDEDGITHLVSYSRTIARRFRVNNGLVGEHYKTWVILFITKHKYSMTTSRHCSLARNASRDQGELFMVNSLPSTVEEALIIRDELLSKETPS